VDQLLARQHEILAAQPVAAAALGELAGRHVERQQHVLTRSVAGLLDRLHEQIERRRVAGEIRREAALVADTGREPLFVQQILQRVEHLGAHADRGRELSAPAGTSMNSWKSMPLSAWAPPLITLSIGNRHEASADAAEIGVERQAGVVGRGAGDGQRHREDRVGAERGLVRCAVELEQRLIHRRLLGGLHAIDLGRDRLLDVAHRLLHTLAAIALAVAVAQLDRLALAGRRARGHRRAPQPPTRAALPPRRWGCRASPGSRERTGH